jgi:hypothetical protein
VLVPSADLVSPNDASSEGQVLDNGYLAVGADADIFTSTSTKLLQPHKIEQELAPKVEHPAP